MPLDVHLLTPASPLVDGPPRLQAPQWVGAIRFASFWFYSMGLFTSLALPTPADRAAFAANHTLERYSISSWSWDGHPERDVAMLLAMALVHRTLAFLVLRSSKKLRFS